MDINSVRFLISARKRGADFGSVLMLGRQSLNVYQRTMEQILSDAGISVGHFGDAAPNLAFAEPLFQALGATEISSMDASGFEGAQFVHDLNLPIAPDLQERFDIVYDGGTLEHVFNFPTALRNAMEMVRVGGRLFIHTCANNMCGHGFYQFSPELFFRTLSTDNGFKVERMVLHMIGPYGRWYEVSDPNEIRARVELITFAPIQMLVEARRVAAVPVFATAPYQSDYSALWKESDSKPAPKNRGSVLQTMLPGVARLLNVGRMGLDFYRRQSLRNRKSFRPVSKQE
jgi:hypothetical protein